MARRIVTSVFSLALLLHWSWSRMLEVFPFLTLRCYYSLTKATQPTMMNLGMTTNNAGVNSMIIDQLKNGTFLLWYQPLQHLKLHRPVAKNTEEIVMSIGWSSTSTLSMEHTYWLVKIRPRRNNHWPRWVLLKFLLCDFLNLLYRKFVVRKACGFSRTTHYPESTGSYRVTDVIDSIATFHRCHIVETFWQKRTSSTGFQKQWQKSGRIISYLLYSTIVHNSRTFFKPRVPYEGVAWYLIVSQKRWDNRCTGAWRHADLPFGDVELLWRCSNIEVPYEIPEKWLWEQLSAASYPLSKREENLT